MISFEISFLLAFPIVNNAKPNGDLLNRPSYVGCVHLSYELIPGKCKYDLDVICWGTVSRVVTKEGQITLRTIIKRDKAWVPFAVDHNLGHLKLDEIRKLRDHVVKFSITYNDVLARKTMMPTYQFEADESFYEFTVTGTQKDTLENYLRTLVIKCSNFTKSELISWLHSPDNYDKLYDIMDEVAKEDMIQRCQIVGPSKSRTQTLPVRRSNVVITVNAEIFFAHPFCSIHSEKSITGPVSDAYVLIKVRSLMSMAQKLILNPLIIKIDKLKNIPTDILKSCGIHSIYFSYNIPAVLTFKSEPKPLSEKIKFDENHVYFTDEVEKIKLFEFLQSQRFYVEIYGNRTEIEEQPHCSLFGQEPDDYKISLIQSYYEEPERKLPNTILLAVAAYDVSSLLENFWNFKEIAQCHVPTSTFYQKSDAVNYEDTIYTEFTTTNEINLKSPKYQNYPLLVPESVYLKLETTLKIEMYVMAPQAASLILHQFPNTFKRLFIIFHAENGARLFYEKVEAHNKEAFEAIKKNPNQKILDLEDILTGFLLDNGNSFAMFIEGPSSGFILNAWHLVNHISAQEAKVFFNTESVFEKRLYQQFLEKGVFTVTLKLPLFNILSKYELYQKRNVPVPCMEALKKFSVLFHASSLRSIFQQNILPHPNELSSLDIEWGIPLRWKKHMLPKVVSMFVMGDKSF